MTDTPATPDPETTQAEPAEADPGPPTEMVHYAGLDISLGSLLRQRCSWCGGILVDVDTANTAVALTPCPSCEGSGIVEEDHGQGMREALGCPDCQGTGDQPPGPYPTFPVGSLVAVDLSRWVGGTCTSFWVIDAETSAEDPNAKKIPANACSELLPDLEVLARAMDDHEDQTAGYSIHVLTGERTPDDKAIEYSREAPTFAEVLGLASDVHRDHAWRFMDGAELIEGP